MDETAPLLRSHETIVNDDAKTANIVDFDPKGDIENPCDWPRAYKWTIVALLAFNAFTTTFTCIGVVPVANKIVADLDGAGSSKSASVLLVTIWELGEAAGPLLIAPLSEAVGRYPVINGANTLFTAATILGALAPSSAVLITARFLTGLAVASNVLNPAIIGDMFISEQRGAAMSLVFLAPLLGGAIGPAASAAIAQSMGWPAILWLCAAVAGTGELIFLFCFKETFAVTILARKAARLRQETGNSALQSVHEARESAEPKNRRLMEAVLRPFVVLFGSGVLQAMAIYGSVSFTFFYIMSTTLPDILQDVYGLSPTATGLCFIAFSIGSIASVVFCNIYLDRIYTYLRDRHTDTDGGSATQTEGVPEHRLPLALVGAVTMPPIVLLYGLVPALHLPLPLMLVMVALFGSALMLGYLPVISYVVDAFGAVTAASALTAVIVVRCLVGTFLPLTTGPLVERLGYGGAFAVLAGVCAVLAPLPFIVMKFGGKWRQRSAYTRDGVTNPQ